MLALYDELISHSFESLERIPNERQSHVSGVLITQSIDFLAVSSRSILLWDLVDREVADIDVGRQLGFEWSANGAEVVPLDVVEEGMRFDSLSAVLG